MKNISIDELIQINKMITLPTGGLYGVRDIHGLHAALNRSQAGYGNFILYNDLFSKIAAITYSLIQNHCFIDGNKRTATIVMLTLLKINQVEISFVESNLYDLILDIANHYADIPEMVHFLESYKI